MDDLIADHEVGPPKPARRPSAFTPARGWVVVGLYATTAALAFAAARSGSPGDVADRSAWLVAACAGAGPFDGAIARHGQSCCLAFSEQLAAICGPALLLGVAAQFAPLSFLGRFAPAARLGAWTLGWLAWFLGVPASLLHAFG